MPNKSKIKKKKKNPLRFLLCSQKGWERMKAEKPEMCYLDEIKSEWVDDHGMVHVFWKLEEDKTK